MKQKLIMENWRKFVKEETEKEILEEAILSKLAGLMLVLNIGGKRCRGSIKRSYRRLPRCKSKRSVGSKRRPWKLVN